VPAPQVWLVDALDPGAPPACVSPRHPGHEYFLEHWRGALLALSNRGRPGGDYELAAADAGAVLARRGGGGGGGGLLLQEEAQQQETLQQQEPGNKQQEHGRGGGGAAAGPVWRTLVPERPGAAVVDLDVFDGAVVLHELRGGRPGLALARPAAGGGGVAGGAVSVTEVCGAPSDLLALRLAGARRRWRARGGCVALSPRPRFAAPQVQLPPWALAMAPGANQDYGSPVFRLSLSSPVDPPAVFDLTLAVGALAPLRGGDDRGGGGGGGEPQAQLLAEGAAGGAAEAWSRGGYTCARAWVPSAGGARVPLTLMWREGAAPRGGGPALLQVYGAYGQVGGGRARRGGLQGGRARGAPGVARPGAAPLGRAGSAPPAAACSAPARSLPPPARPILQPASAPPSAPTPRLPRARQVLDADYDASRRALMDRGWVVALAHVRGGGELGRRCGGGGGQARAASWQGRLTFCALRLSSRLLDPPHGARPHLCPPRWHAAGRQLLKRNSVADLLACARWLVSSGAAARGRVAGHAASAGCLALAAALNEDPGLFGAAVLEAPFLDLLGAAGAAPVAQGPAGSGAGGREGGAGGSGGGAAHMLTQHERDEWGDPRAGGAALTALRELCPYANAAKDNGGRGGGGAAGGYPPLLLLAGTGDERVPWRGAVKFAAKRRAAAAAGAGADAAADLGADGAAPADGADGAPAPLVQRGDVLLRVEPGGGHFSLGLTSRRAEEMAEVYAFLLAALP
jgi:hypothetical protein